MLRCSCIALLLSLSALCAPARAIPHDQKGVEDLNRSGAFSSPGAAWHHLFLAQEAAQDGRTEEAVSNYRLSAEKDPDLVGPGIGLAIQGIRRDPQLVYEGLAGAAQAIARSWELQRRLVAAALPAFWMATLLAATALLAGVALRHLSSTRHILVESFQTRLGARAAAGLAAFLCLLPLGVPWGLAATAAAYAALVHSEMTRSERQLVLVAVATLLLVPGLWRTTSSYFAPLDTRCLSWLIERTQKEVPTPELQETVRRASAFSSSPQFAFAEGMLHRRCLRFEEANASFATALDAGEPIAAHARVNLGNLLLWGGDTPGAARCYEQVLDEPYARLEGRYNLAIALSRLHRFEEAEERLEEATRLDFDRVRAAVQRGAHKTNGDVMDGMLRPIELWHVDHSARGQTVSASVPPVMAWFLPKGRLGATPLAVLAGLLIGGVTGIVLSRRFRVHACQHCGAPVCRRCVTRSGGHAYCERCASMLGSLPKAAYNRVLLRRLLGKELVRGERVRGWIEILTPGLGPVLRGRPLSGLTTGWLFAFGVLFATRAAWAFPVSPGTRDLELLLRAFGAVLALGAWGRSFVVARRARPHRGVRHHFETDVYYRLAA